MEDDALEEIVGAVGELLDTKDRLVCAEVDYGACGTRMDRDRLTTCRMEFDDAYEAFVETVRRVLKQERREVRT